MAVVAQDVLDLLGGGSGVAVEQVEAALSIVEATVYSYTRGVGFGVGLLPGPTVFPSADLSQSAIGDPDEALTTVIVSAAARMANNPTADTYIQVDGWANRPGGFQGFTLAELMILNTYRKRAI